jgi:hypothetical protein
VNVIEAVKFQPHQIRSGFAFQSGETPLNQQVRAAFGNPQPLTDGSVGLSSGPQFQGAGAAGDNADFSTAPTFTPLRGCGGCRRRGCGGCFFAHSVDLLFQV